LWDGASQLERRGQTVEVAQFESTVATIGDELLAAQRNGVGDPGHGPGNRSTVHAPQGVYPCHGDDRWIALTVLDDAGWSALCALVGLDESLRALSVAERLARHDEIDRHLSAWSSEHEQRDLAALLQHHGIAAGAVLDAPGLLDDPHLADRKLLVELDQPALGPFVTAAMPIRLSRTTVRPRHRAPLLGEHNHEVLASLAGMADDEIAALAADGVIADRPPN